MYTKQLFGTINGNVCSHFSVAITQKPYPKALSFKPYPNGNVRGPVTEHVLTYVRGKMPGGFVDIAGITARTQKHVYHTCMEPTSASHIFKHLENSEQCHTLCSNDCFSILDHASATFQLKIKEAIHILWEKPTLNHQLYHVNLSNGLHSK